MSSQSAIWSLLTIWLTCQVRHDPRSLQRTVESRKSSPDKAEDDVLVVNAMTCMSSVPKHLPNCLGSDGRGHRDRINGLFTEAEKAKAHHCRAKKVIISAPAKNEDITVVNGR